METLKNLFKKVSDFVNQLKAKLGLSKKVDPIVPTPVAASIVEPPKAPSVDPKPTITDLLFPHAPVSTPEVEAAKSRMVANSSGVYSLTGVGESIHAPSKPGVKITYVVAFDPPYNVFGDFKVTAFRVPGQPDSGNYTIEAGGQIKTGGNELLELKGLQLKKGDFVYVTLTEGTAQGVAIRGNSPVAKPLGGNPRG